MYPVNSTRRPAFTLVELIVVMAIIITLSALAVALLPGMNDRQRTSQGAVLFQNTILAAKQLAIRDGQPRGLQLGNFGVDTLLTDPLIHGMQFIEQPIDMTGTGVQLVTAGTATVGLSGVDFSDSSVVANDLLRIGDEAWMTIQSVGSGSPQQVTLTPNDVSFFSTWTAGQVKNFPFTISRSARPMAGQNPIRFPEQVGLNIATTTNAGQSAPLTILFGPTGQVINANGSAVLLYVVDNTDNLNGNPNSLGQQTVIAVYTRTGYVAAHPLATGNIDIFAFARDGRGSGQ